MVREFAPDLASCQTLSQLGTALGVSQANLELLSSDSRRDHYRLHKIPKRNRHRRGEFRLLYEPNADELKHFHRTISRRLTLYISQVDPTFPAACSFGYIRRRSTKDNAFPHRGARLLLRADIKDFFPTLSINRVEALLRTLRIRASLASILARIVCLDGTLSQGLSASPVIANYACHGLDRRLLELAEHYSATYTRYADDIAISGPAVPTQSEMSSVLAKEGFILSSSKFRITKQGQAQFVTGLSVSDSVRPHVPRHFKRRLRQEMYYSRKFGVAEHLMRVREPTSRGVNRLDGTVTYVGFIEKGGSYDMRRQWESLLSRDDLKPQTHARHDRPPGKQFTSIDETIFKSGDTNYLALGFALFGDRDLIESQIKETIDDYIADPFAPGKKNSIKKAGLHYAEAHPDLRTAFIEKLPALPFRCYVALAPLRADSDYDSTYLQAFNWLMYQLFRRCDRQELTMLVEQNPRISAQQLQASISELYPLLRAAGIQRPLNEPTLTVVSKKEPTVALPDFMLGVLGRHVSEGPSDGAASALQFERLRDRYSLIFNLETATAYSRRNPFFASSLRGSAD